jgi:hypothetical protein
MSDMERRAFQAYFRSRGKGAPRPSNDPRIVEVDGNEYIILENINGTLAAYRIVYDDNARDGFRVREVSSKWVERMLKVDDDGEGVLVLARCAECGATTVFDFRDVPFPAFRGACPNCGDAQTFYMIDWHDASEVDGEQADAKVRMWWKREEEPTK